MRALALAVLFGAALAASGCGGGSAPATAPAAPATPAERGRALFERKVGGLSCADCHSTSAEDQPDPARRRVGHTLADATRRPSWWHGSIEAGKGTVGDALLTCVARFHHRNWNRGLPVLADGRRDLSKVEVPAGDREALVAYLDSVARPGPHPPSPSKPDASREALARVRALPGDPERGKVVWDAACALCHGHGGANNLGPSLRGDDRPDATRVIAYVRSGPNRTERETYDRWMPAFAPDALPDQDLADVAALIDGGEW